MVDKLDCAISNKDGTLSIDCASGILNFFSKRIGFIITMILLLSILCYVYYKMNHMSYSVSSSPLPGSSLPSSLYKQPKPLPDDLSTVSVLRISQLTEDELGSLSTLQILSLTAPQIKSMTSYQIEALSKTAIDNIDVEKQDVTKLCADMDKASSSIPLVTKCIDYMTSQVPLF
jgi:hypothetical protein